MKRRKSLAGKRQPDMTSAMSAAACDIAVSEMTGIPAERLCGYIVVTVAHSDRAGKGHEVGIMPSGPDWPWAVHWLEKAAADARRAL